MALTPHGSGFWPTGFWKIGYWLAQIEGWSDGEVQTAPASHTAIRTPATILSWPPEIGDNSAWKATS